MKRLIVVFLLAVALPAFAYDFESERSEGYSLFFNFYQNDDENAVEVTYPMASGNSYWYGYRMPWGELTIPSTVEYNGTLYTVVAIGDRAFSGCSEITSVVLPPTITEIGSYSFYQCTGITGTLTIGEEIVSVGRSAFYGCSGINVLQFDAVKCETMGGSRSTTAFGNCRSLTKVKFGPKVRRIPDFAFSGMDLLQYEWQLPRDLEYIGEMAFAYCNQIYGPLNLPDSVKIIEQSAFAQCHSISKVRIPARIQRIGKRAFLRCINIATVECLAFVPPELGEYAFYDIKSKASLYVPCISTNDYRNNDEWKKVGVVRAMEPCELDVVARVSNPDGGVVSGGGTHKVGTKATLTAICKAGFGFKGWSDGNIDNPRSVIIVDTTSYTAIIEPVEVVHEVEYVHDTTYLDGVKVVYEYYEINDVAEPINSQKDIVYNREKRRIEIPIDKNEILDAALYNDAGQCVLTGRPRHGYINMRRYPSGYYIIRVSTFGDETVLRFFHNKNK